MKHVEVAGVRARRSASGCWQFGSRDWGYGKTYGDVTAVELVHTALDLGVNLVDTAGGVRVQDQPEPVHKGDCWLLRRDPGARCRRRLRHQPGSSRGGTLPRAHVAARPAPHPGSGPTCPPTPCSVTPRRRWWSGRATGTRRRSGGRRHRRADGSVDRRPHDVGRHRPPDSGWAFRPRCLRCWGGTWAAPCWGCWNATATRHPMWTRGPCTPGAADPQHRRRELALPARLPRRVSMACSPRQATARPPRSCSRLETMRGTGRPRPGRIAVAMALRPGLTLYAALLRAT